MVPVSEDHRRSSQFAALRQLLDEALALKARQIMTTIDAKFRPNNEGKQ